MTRRLAPLALAALALALVPAAAQASRTDRNKDRIPDRWERAHHLSLSVKQTAKDQDHDGLRNLAEWRNHTDPRNADSDHDGIDDGAEVEVASNPLKPDSDGDGTPDDAENAGTIQSFTGGMLTISLAGGQTLTAAVDPAVTEIECGDHAAASAPIRTLRSQDGGGDDGQQGDGQQGDGQHGDDSSGPGPVGGTGPAAGSSGPGAGDDDGPGDDDGAGDDGQASCTAASLTVGAIVHEAEVKTIGAKAVFTKIEIIPAPTM